MYLNFAYHYDAWQKTPLGQALLAEEGKIIWRFLQDLHHDFWLQIGGPTALDPKPPINPTHQHWLMRRIYLFSEIVTTQLPSGNHVVADLEALPFLEGSFNTVFLWHSLEIAKDPKQTLAEIRRILKPEGIVIIIDFNPFSCLGLRHFWQKHHSSHHAYKRQLAKTHYFSATRIKWWLRRLDLVIEKDQKIFFRPPINNATLLKRSLFLETFGAMFANGLGNVNVIVARKKTIGLTPLLDTEELMQPSWPALNASGK